MCTLVILQNSNSNTIKIMYTYQYLFTNSSPPWRTSLWSLWKFMTWYTWLLFHIFDHTFFCNTLQLATSIFKWQSWCQWIYLFLFPSFLPSFFLIFIIWILVLGPKSFWTLSSTCLQQGTQFWNYTCSCHMKEHRFTHSVRSDSKSPSQSLINVPFFLQPSPENRKRSSLWKTVFISEKEMMDDVQNLFILRVIYYHHNTLDFIWLLPHLVL